MDKKVVAVIFGGVSTEHEISKLSATNIISALNEEKYFILPIYITRDGRWFLHDGGKDSIKHLQWEKFATPCIISPNSNHHGVLRLVGDKFKVMHIDVAIPILHGKNGEDGTIQGLLEMSGIPYVGSGVLASALCIDKAACNLIAKSLGIKQPDYLVFDKDYVVNSIEDCTKTIRYKLGYPCFVKPARTGSSVGINMVNNKKELINALKIAIEHDNKVVIEKLAAGRELECAILGGEASSIGEITHESSFYDYDAKYIQTTSKCIIPADIPIEISDKIKKISKEIYHACGCKSLARVDFFLTNDNEILFNEVNTMPGCTNISMYHMLWRHEGKTNEEIVEYLIQTAYE